MYIPNQNYKLTQNCIEAIKCTVIERNIERRQCRGVNQPSYRTVVTKALAKNTVSSMAGLMQCVTLLRGYHGG